MDNNEGDKNQLQLRVPNVALEIDATVLAVLSADAASGFQRAYMMADAVSRLKAMLTHEYMKPIMELQGSRLGFKTDKDKEGGYPEPIVKGCLIEAVLMGLLPTGNQFNIIAGNTYVTKEGCGHQLSKIPGLQYTITFELPRIKDESAAVVALIEWTLNGVSNQKRMDTPIKANKYMGADGVLGKAERKARHWLYKTITGSELPEGEVQDVNATVVEPADPAAAKGATQKATEDLDRILKNKPIREQIAKLKTEQDGLDQQDAKYLTLAEEIEKLESQLQ